MVASNFVPSLARALIHEGGYSNHPKDPGGVTLEGIIQRVYDAYRKAGGKPQKPLTSTMRGDPGWIAERDEIYSRNYWRPSRCDDLPAGLDYCVFDGSVNSGVGQSAKWLQRALAVTADGVVGDITVAAAKAAPDIPALIDNICDQRLAMLKKLKTWPTFGKGWSARVADVREAAKAMAKSPAVQPTVQPPRTGESEGGKAVASDRSLGSILRTPEGLAGGISVATSALNAAADPGPLQWALAAAVLVAVATGAFYFTRRARAAT